MPEQTRHSLVSNAATGGLCHDVGGQAFVIDEDRNLLGTGLKFVGFTPLITQALKHSPEAIQSLFSPCHLRPIPGRGDHHRVESPAAHARQSYVSVSSLVTRYSRPKTRMRGSHFLHPTGPHHLFPPPPLVRAHRNHGGRQRQANKRGNKQGGRVPLDRPHEKLLPPIRPSPVRKELHLDGVR